MIIFHCLLFNLLVSIGLRDDQVWIPNQFGYEIGVLLIVPDDSHIPLAFKLRFRVSNNQAEYEACIAELEAALELGQ